ncbi:MAG: DEAD/DEAH box helicase family protein [Vicingaceae bacterium]|nr:DEAD/DEAH box helicase family protein [Vicingaceae bacterium]
MLKSADFKPFYATGLYEPSDFFIEGLTNSQQFDLGLGYFRSTGFKSLAIGFSSFIQNGGKMRFIINDSLTEKDKAAIITGENTETDKDYEQQLINDIKLLTKTLTKRDEHFFNCLSWLIASDRLQIIAVKPAKNKVGIVHHKFGIFTDNTNGEKNQAVFNGSVNFSQYALEKNVETIWCEYSWEAQGLSKQRISEVTKLFEDTWSGKSQAVRIIPIEEVKEIIAYKFPKKKWKELVEDECEIAEQLIKEYEKLGSDPKKIKETLEALKKNSEKIEVQFTPKPTKKWKHQDDAISKFLEKKRGVLNMATGTGKTRTALRICFHLIDSKEIDSIIVACDGTDLLNQWYKEVLELIVSKDLGWSILRQYDTNRENQRFKNNCNQKILLTSRLQLHSVMQNIEEKEANRMLLIHDEVHKLGSMGNQEKLEGLSNHIRFRLGLSATPDREFDDEGTQFIKDHIGEVIFEFGLDKAIQKGILSPFNYYPVQYELTQEDRDRVKQVFKRRSASEQAGTPMTEEEFRNAIANVYKTAEGKIPTFRNFIAQHTELLDKCVVFVETKAYGEEILNIIHQYRTDFHSYFSGDDSNVLSRFSRGEIDCLLTCHRISEGIDIPSLNNVILISSARKRIETIQRIGRCIRLDPQNLNKVANVVDFIRVNDKEDSDLNADQEREIFLQELASIKPEK